MSLQRMIAYLVISSVAALMASTPIRHGYAAASSATATGLHDIVYVVRTDVFVSEASGSAGIEIARCCHGSYEASVQAATTGGTAAEGADYTPTSRTIRFSGPAENADLSFPVSNDLDVEPLETVDVVLSDATAPMSIAGGGRGTVTLIDNDGPIRFSFARIEHSTFENYGTVELAIVRSGDAAGQVSVNYGTSDGTAVAGQDYTTTSGTVTFADGQRVMRIDLPVVNDRAVEETESFNVTLTDPVGGEIAEPSVATVSIADDESPGSDTSPPVSYFHQPLHGKTYRAGELRDILAFADDYGVGVKVLRIALRSKLDNGTCRWFSKRERRFVAGACGTKKWMRFLTSETVVYEFPRLLEPSRGTRINYYKAWSSGIDKLGNVETEFQVNRNVSRFEVR